MNNQDLFVNTNADGSMPFGPLAAKMRPRDLSEYVGQEHLLGNTKPLRQAIELQQVHSMILWGPPGVGKTTLAKLIGHHLNAHCISLSAVLCGVKEIRQAIEIAQQKKQVSGAQTLLFVDEVHRFNKAQQDAFLPFVEDGTILFIGATTENPSFEVNNALLSRCRVFVLKPLEKHAMNKLVFDALSDVDRGLGKRRLTIASTALDAMVMAANGDARKALNVLEVASDLIEDGHELSLQDIKSVVGADARLFDKGGDIFYDQISALHKSVRGSDPDASLYWLLRMLNGGCDPLYIARRLVRIASEDIGNADPRALAMCLDAWHVQERLGMPEGELALAQAVLYLAAAAKSNAVYNAFKTASADVRSLPDYDVPMQLRNAPTALMKNLDYGKGYRYAHDEPDAFAAGECYFPNDMEERHYYQPVDRGLEIQISKKLNRLRMLNKQVRKEKHL